MLFIRRKLINFREADVRCSLSSKFCDFIKHMVRYAWLISIIAGLCPIWLETRMSLLKSLLWPHFHYCTKAFNACVKFVFGLRRRYELHYFKNLLAILDYLKVQSLLFVYKVNKTGSPLYIFEKLRFPKSTRTYIY